MPTTRKKTIIVFIIYNVLYTRTYKLLKDMQNSTPRSCCHLIFYILYKTCFDQYYCMIWCRATNEVFFLKRSPGLDSNFLLLRLINKSVLNILEVSFSSVKLVMFTNTLLNNILRIFTTADSAKYHYYTSSTNFNRLHSYLRDYHRTAICYLFRILFVQLFSMNSPLPIRLTLGYS